MTKQTKVKKNPKDYEFKEGNQLATRSRGRVRKGTSKIRQTLNRFKDMEDDAIDLINRSLLNEGVNSESLSTAKWVITTMVSLNRAAIADEQLSFNTKVESRRLYREENNLNQKATGTNDATPNNVLRFSTKMQDVDDED